jgi:hypothetical protein
MKNWKTTATGICTILVIVSNAALAVLDGDPTTVPDIAGAVAGIIAALGLIFAKDAGITGTEK